MQKLIIIVFLISNYMFSYAQSLRNYPGIIQYDLKTINPACLTTEYKLAIKVISMNEFSNKHGITSTIDYLSFDKPLPKLKSSISLTPGIVYKTLLIDHDRLYKSNQFFFHFTFNYNPFSKFFIGLTTSFYFQNATFDPRNSPYNDSIVSKKQLYLPELSFGIRYENHGFGFGLCCKNIIHTYRGVGLINSSDQNSARQIFYSISYLHQWKRITNKTIVILSAYPDFFNSYFNGADIFLQNTISYKKLVDFGITTNIFPVNNIDYSIGILVKGRFFKDRFQLGASIDFFDVSPRNNFYKVWSIPFNMLLTYNIL